MNYFKGLITTAVIYAIYINIALFLGDEPTNYDVIHFMILLFVSANYYNTEK